LKIKIFSSTFIKCSTTALARNCKLKSRKIGSRGRCYDHNFLRFFPIFGEKIGVFLKYQCYDQLFSKFSFVSSQKRQFFAKFFGENILKIITSAPGANPKTASYNPGVVKFTTSRVAWSVLKTKNYFTSNKRSSLLKRCRCSGEF
jgi:hypothetical protein